MANDSQNLITPKSDGSEFIWIYVIWICFFATVALPNLLIAVGVLRYKALRELKEYLILGALCLSDFLDLSYNMGAGLHRIALISRGLWTHTRSPWSCILLPHNLLACFSMPCHSLMLLIISVDRLYAVASPVKYFNAKKPYAYRMIGLAYFPSFCMLVCTFCLAFLNQDSSSLQMPCFLGPLILSLNEYYPLLHLYVEPVSGITSVVLYVLVGVVYWNKSSTQVADQGGGVSATQARKRQIVLTKSLAISSLCTCIFLVIPVVIGFTGDILDLPRRWLQPFWVLPPLNPAANLIIIYKRQPHIVEAVRAMVHNKIMPPTIALWQDNNSQRNNQRN